MPMKTIEQMQAEFDERQANPPERIDNGSLYAGSPMHYYCIDCGHKAAVLPESHTCAVPKRCGACKELREALDGTHVPTS